MYVDEVYKAVGAVQALQVFDIGPGRGVAVDAGHSLRRMPPAAPLALFRQSSLTTTQGYVEAGYGNYNDRPR